MKNSKQRELVLNIINSSNLHPTAEDIYFECRKLLPNISLGTVYRNLKVLTESNKITRIKSKDNTYRYDNNLKKHAHFVCRECGELSDISRNVLDEIQTIDGHKVLDYEINFEGICKDCLR
ncbi:MAG: transcriptional repressor [Clostridia bacterium]|nr:transcriptional repressor [Clostridia bacterium]